MTLEKPCLLFKCVALCALLLAAVVSSNHHGNPANDLVELINKNRTAQKLTSLNTSPGLGCIALQYAEECKGNCTSNNTPDCHPSPDDFTEVFAPNCGVELPTFGAISSYIIGCQQQYLTPPEAFSQLLARDKKSLSIVTNGTHNEVGVGVYGLHKHKGPYFWCVLFSTSRTNSTFVLDDLGEGIKQKRGCYSGSNDSCSRGTTLHSNILVILLMHVPIFVLYCFNPW